MKDDGVGVRRRYSSDVVVAMPRRDGGVRIHDRGEREGDVTAGERRAVVPADVAPQVVDDRQPVLRDAAVFERGDDRRQNRMIAAFGIGCDQRIEDEGLGDRFKGLCRKDWIEGLDIAGERDPQRPGDRPWMATRGATRRPTDARATGKEGRGEKRRRSAAKETANGAASDDGSRRL